MDGVATVNLGGQATGYILVHKHWISEAGEEIDRGVSRRGPFVFSTLWLMPNLTFDIGGEL